MDVQIKIKNLAQIRAAFLMAPTLMKKNLAKAIALSTFKVGRDSRINTPVDTGRLRASTRERITPFKGIVATHVNYDIFVHEGTRYMKGRPFLRNALESNEPFIQEQFRKATQDTLNSIGRKT